MSFLKKYIESLYNYRLSHYCLFVNSHFEIYQVDIIKRYYSQGNRSFSIKTKVATNSSGKKSISSSPFRLNSFILHGEDVCRRYLGDRHLN